MPKVDALQTPGGVLSQRPRQTVDVPREARRTSTFRPDIEGLRGIAVLLVVAFHCGVPGFSGGFIGVDVFFVLSGYLITGLLITEIGETSRISLLKFYARRARRLLPASALTVLITLLVGAVILAPNELTFAGRAARATALYVSNIFFSVNAADYFAPRVESNPMLHTWSLAVEEQFYMFWPLLIMLGLQRWRSRKALVALLSALTVISLAACVWLTANRGTFAFYQLPARAWEFGLGGLAVLIPRGSWKPIAGGWPWLGWFGILTILASGRFIVGDTNFPGWVALLPVIGTVAALIAGAEQPHRGAGALLDSAPLQMLGSHSYSWYLWHWPFLIFSAALLPSISVPAKIAVSVASLGFAAAMHNLVENPIRFQPYLLKRPALSLCLAAALTLCSVGAAVLTMRFALRLSNTPELKSIADAEYDIARLPRQQCVTPRESPDVKTCVFGNALSATDIVLFGDSHAIQWFNPLQRIAEAHGWKLTTLVKSGCPAADVEIPGYGAKFTADCANWRADAMKRIIAMHPALVFIGNATFYVKGEDKTGSPLSVSLEQWRDGTRRTFRALTAAGLQIAAMRDNPTFQFDVPTCLARSIRHSWYPRGSCETNEAVALNQAVFEAEAAGARDLPNIHFIDLTDRLCPRNVCLSVWQGAVMYRDNNHLTGSFAESLKPELEAALLPILATERQNP